MTNLTRDYGYNVTLANGEVMYAKGFSVVDAVCNMRLTADFEKSIVKVEMVKVINRLFEIECKLNGLRATIVVKAPTAWDACMSLGDTAEVLDIHGLDEAIDENSAYGDWEGSASHN